ncbi:MAG: sigma-54 dependent transcriptional regulator [Pelobacteraceae bacterium]
MKDTSGKSPLIVLVDDEPQLLFSCATILRRAGLHNLHTIEDGRTLFPFLAEQLPALIVLDLTMPNISGLELLNRMSSEYPQVPVIVMTATSELNTAVECMKNGAFDYLVKPVEQSRYLSSVKRALELDSLRQINLSLKESLLTGKAPDKSAFADIITQCAAMKAIFSYLEAVAVSDQPILITGETGVGKELFSHAVHSMSRRSGGFVAVNVAGLDDTVFSDTLFGHKKGAYTGADQAREGMIAKAAGGTLFLDEIGDLNTASQVKLLRLLQEGEYYPLGSDVVRRSDARIVVATNQELSATMTGGKFRKDLYFRLCAHQITIPPLRERQEDIPLLFDHFVEEALQSLSMKLPEFPPELFDCLYEYPFPGNVREFRAMIHDAVAQEKNGVPMLESLRKKTGFKASPQRSITSDDQLKPFLDLRQDRIPTLKEAEDMLIAEALRRSNGSQGPAAVLLGITRQALNQRLVRKKTDLPAE